MKTLRTLLALAILICTGNTELYSQGTPCTAVSANTNCSAPTSASIPASWTAAGSGISNPACGGATNNGNYWITYTVPAGVTSWYLNVSPPGTGGSKIDDVGVQVYTASSATCASATFTLQNCFNDAGASVQREFTVTPGQIYYIRIFDTDGNGSGTNFVYCTTPNVTGNTPCSARPITSFPYTFSGNTTASGINNYMTGGCGGNYIPTSGAANDYFFSVNVAANSYLTFNLSGTTSGNYTELSVLTASSCSGTFTCVANGAWSGGLQAQGGATSSPCKTVYFATAGTYYIRIDGNTGSNGPFTLSVNSYTPTAGDACSNAIGMSSGSPVTINNTNCNYTMGPDDPSPSSLFCAGTVENTNWLLFQSNGSGTPISVNVNAVTCASGYYAPGPPAGLYSASGQFGILTSSTGTCGGTYTSAVACQSLSTGSTFSTTLPNTSVVNYYFIWDGNGGAECTYTITVTNVNPLPIELISFTGQIQGKKAMLKWATNAEVNNDFFTVERSLDSKVFSVVNTVKGKGNSNDLNFYTVYDNEPNLNGVTYYRLKQTDFNGSFQYSDIIAVQGESEKKAVLFPNPFMDELTLQLSEKISSQVDLTLTDVTGNVILRKSYAEVNSKEVKIPVSAIRKGIYFYKVSFDGKVTTGRLVKS